MNGPAKVPYSETALFRQRHSAAHILAQAVLELFPGTKLGAGPPTDDGFYCDFELPRPLTDDDLPRIEARMREIIREDVPFIYRKLEADEARRLFEDPGALLVRDLAARAALTSPALGTSFLLIVKVSMRGGHFHGAVRGDIFIEHQQTDALRLTTELATV
jgi:hypothetical protein